MKYFRIFEIAYLVVFVLAIIEAFREWTINPQRAWLFLGFAAISLFMFFFRRRYRKKFEARQREK
jgi:hypothetical protein